MKSQRIIGKKCYLKPLSKSDITETVLGWLRDPLVIKYIESKPPRSLKDLKLFYDKLIKSKNDRMFAIFDKSTNTHIGNIKLDRINYTHQFCYIAILIGNKDYWGRGYCQEAIFILLKYVFNSLKFRKVFLSVCEDNKAAIKAYAKVGFKIEGKSKDLYCYDGKYFDKIYMGILKGELKSGSDFNKR